MSTAGGSGRPRVRTGYGVVEGRTGPAGTFSFRGIPYAAPPVGALRFAAPAPPAAWEGVRDAGAFGPTAPKVPYPPKFAALLPDPDVPGDDCLNLNVWTPDPYPGARLPVMVWLHGGALTRGSSAVPVYDGSAFARDGVVLVSVNYRLGVLGYGLFPDAPANRGLLDQIAALNWVRENIGAFGGDPARVTVFGESAGAISVGALLGAPRAAGLFAQAALQSGAPEVLAREKVRAMVRRMASLLKVPATARAFGAAALPDLLAAQAAVLRRSSPLTGGPAFGLVTDPDTLPGDPLEAATATDVPLLLGWTTEEYRLWLAPIGALPVMDRLGPLTVALARARSGKDRAAVRALRAALPGAGPAELAGQLLTDRLLRDPLRSLAGARR
ncbi:carboxylesterase/lipase family protein, partial [Streptomyces sp. NPDC001193]